MEGHNNNNHRNKKNLAIKTQDLLLPQKDEQETIFNPRDETRMLTMEGKNEEEVLQIMTERINMLSQRKEESRRASFKSTRLFMVKMTFQQVRKEYEKIEEEKKSYENNNVSLTNDSSRPVPLRRSQSEELANTFSVDREMAREEIKNADGDFSLAGQALLKKALSLNTMKNAERMRVQDCANCHTNLATVVNLPCGHVLYCEECHKDKFLKRYDEKNRTHVCPVCFDPTTGSKIIGSTKICCAICQTNVGGSYLITTNEKCMHRICICCAVEKFRRSLDERLGNIVKGGLLCRIRLDDKLMSPRNSACQQKMGISKIKELQKLSNVLHTILKRDENDTEDEKKRDVQKHRHPMEISERRSSWHCDGCGAKFEVELLS